MAFIGFVKKLNSELIKKLVYINQEIVCEDEEIVYFEVCGIVLNHSIFEFEICDFYGTFKVKKAAKLEIKQNGSFIFKIKPYFRDDKIELYCKDYRSVTIYEEMAFNLELKALLEIQNL